MKGFRSTGVLFVLVAALAAYTFYEFKHADEDAAQDRGESPAFTLKREDIGSIKLTQQGLDIELHKSGEIWKMTKPVEDAAEASMVDGFLFSALAQKLKSLNSESEGKDTKWAEFGLEPAATQIEISGKGKSEQIKVSGKTAYDGSYYVRKGDQLLLGDAAIGQLGTRTPGSFRSRKIWHEAEGTTIDSVAVDLALDNRKAKYKAVLAEGKWTIEPKPPFDIDSERIAAWVQRLKDFMPNDFAAEKIDDATKKEFLLLMPSLHVAMNVKRADGSTVPWDVTLGQDKGDDVFLFTNLRSTIYKTSRQGVASLRLPVEAFRNGKKPFQFEVEQAHEVEVHGDKWQHTFVKTDSTWKIKGEPKGLELDQDKLIELFQNVRSLEAQEFSGKRAKVTPRLMVRDAKGAVIFSLAWGDETQPAQPWNQGMKYRWVQSSGLEKEFMGLPKEKLDMLINPDIVKKKPEAKTDTKPEKK